MSGVYFLLILMILSLAILMFLVLRLHQHKNSGIIDLKYKLDSLNQDVRRVEMMMKTEMVSNRGELINNLSTFGELISNITRNSSALQQDQLLSFSNNLLSFSRTMEEKLRLASEADLRNYKESRQELKESLESLRMIFERKFGELQSGNEKKLDEMRATVDEKLQNTLEKRLGESFKLVSERLEAVHKGLGDMQQLAVGVGDLKKVLTNVKTRGVLGEYQLANILEQLFTPDQYSKNVKTKLGSNALVEFAIKMPGREDQVMWLPIDSKFPKEDFELLMSAYESGSAEQIEEHRRNFVKAIRKSAVDICMKYIDPPNTTDFAILFLPFESLYAEVLRTPGLFESIQRECRINIAGPTTLSAFLSSLQMGFRTLAIEKRSSEVWHLLGAVKTQFGLFGNILEKTQKKLQEANNVMEEASKRSRVIEKRLKSVQELPPEQSLLLLGDTGNSAETDDDADSDPGDAENSISSQEKPS